MNSKCVFSFCYIEESLRHKPTTEQEKKEDWQVRLQLEENVRLVHDMQSSIVRDIK